MAPSARASLLSSRQRGSGAALTQRRPGAVPRARTARPARRTAPLRVAASSEQFEAQVCVVLGTQWGDEGKGKLVDILGQTYDVVARAQVSPRLLPPLYRTGCISLLPPKG